MDRRTFLKKGAATAVAAAGIIVPGVGLWVPDSALAQQGTRDAFWSRDRILHARRQGLKETLHIRYFHNGQYDYQAYGRICWFLRDFKDNNRWARFDIDLIDSLWGMQEWSRQEQSQEPVWFFTSAYRTKRRNRTIEGAAFNSFHTRAMAVDGILGNENIAATARRAQHFRIGGIGIYPGFLHADSGPQRVFKRG